MKAIFLFFVFSVCALEDLPWTTGTHGSELEIVRPFLPEDPVILEAGAHYGEDTLAFIHHWPGATVYAFEPYCEYFFQLQKAVSKEPGIEIFPYGLYSKTGFYDFHVSATWDGASSLFASSEGPVEYFDMMTTVLCKKLDEWAEEEQVDRIDYMWLDMEGAELEMFKGAPQILQTVRAISTEVNFRQFRKGMAQFPEMKDYLEKAGFTLFKIWGSPDWQATAVFIREGPIGSNRSDSLSHQGR